MSRMLGALCYAAEDIPRNQWFIQELCKNAEPEGICLRLCTIDTAYAAPPEVQFCINRSRNSSISEYFLQERGVPVFNSAAVTRITNDKYLTYCFLQKWGLPVANTIRVTGEMPMENMEPPLVMKPCCGHGGAGVVLLRDADALQHAIQAASRPFLLQEMMKPGWDLRVYIMAGKVYAAILRRSKRDFRSNFSLGGEAVPYSPDEEILRLTAAVQQILPMDFAAVDFLCHPSGGYVIGEIEDAAGCRMLYHCTNQNPAQDYILTIKNKLAM